MRLVLYEETSVRIAQETLSVRNQTFDDSNKCMATDRQIVLNECRAAVASRNRTDNRIALIRDLQVSASNM